MSAKLDEKQVELYVMDLVWLIAKRSYDGLNKQPSDVYFKREKKEDKRSKQQIIDDLLKGLGGE